METPRKSKAQLMHEIWLEFGDKLGWKIPPKKTWNDLDAILFRLF